MPLALSDGPIPSKYAKIGQKSVKIAAKPLKYSSGPPEFTRMYVNTQGAFIRRNTLYDFCPTLSGRDIELTFTSSDVNTLLIPLQSAPDPPHHGKLILHIADERIHLTVILSCENQLQITFLKAKRYPMSWE